jgi:hypothetical protein
LCHQRLMRRACILIPLRFSSPNPWFESDPESEGGSACSNLAPSLPINSRHGTPSGPIEQVCQLPPLAPPAPRRSLSLAGSLPRLWVDVPGLKPRARWMDYSPLANHRPQCTLGSLERVAGRGAGLARTVAWKREAGNLLKPPQALIGMRLLLLCCGWRMPGYILGFGIAPKPTWC